MNINHGSGQIHRLTPYSLNPTRPHKMNPSSKIYIAGHGGMVGSAIHRCLTAKGYTNIIGKTRAELDLIRQKDVEDYFTRKTPMCCPL
jgi:hypothetical protein